VKNVGNRLYINFETGSRFGRLLPFVERSKSNCPVSNGKVADDPSKTGWSWGCVATVDRKGRTIFIADAHRGDGKRFVVHADEKLTAFLELEAAIRGCGELA
jgi:hypothetical protein